MREKKKVVLIVSAVTLLLGLIGFFIGKEQIMAAENDIDEDRRVIRVGYSPIKGLSEKDENGEYTGLIIDYLNEIAKYTNWKYEYIETSAEESFEDFVAGKFDLMGGIMHSETLQEYFAYPEYSAGSTKATLLARKDDRTMRGYDLHTLNGKTIGVYSRATEKIRRLQEFLSFNDIQCEIIYYSFEDMIHNNLYTYLENGEVDLLLGNDMEDVSEFQVITSFEAQDYYIVAVPGEQEILDGLNMALKNILDADPDFAAECYQANFPKVEIKDIQLNEEELAYIADKKTLSVAVPGEMHPFYCVDKSDAYHKGIIPDLFEEISEFTGLTFNYVHADTYAEAIQLVQDKKADILGCFIESEEMASSMGLALSKSYMGLNNIIIKNKSVNYPGEDLTAAIMNGRQLPDEIKAANVEYYPDMFDALKAVDRGEVDFAYGVATTMENIIQEHHFANTVPLTLVNNNNQINLAISQPITPELLTILNKAIGNLSDSQKSMILDRNIVSVSSSSFKLEDLIYAEPVISIIVVAVFITLILTVIFVVARVRMKNALIRSELEKAEAESKAKGEFLSRMSHEIRTPMNAIVGLADLTCMLPEVPEPVEDNLKKINGSSKYLLSLINDILDMSQIDNGMMTINLKDFSLHDMLGEIESMMRIQAEQREIKFQLNIQTGHDKLRGDPLRLRQVLINLLSNAFKFTKAGGMVSLTVEENSWDKSGVQYTFSVKDTGSGIDAADQERIFEAFEQVGSNISKSEGTGLGLSISVNLVKLMGGELQLKSQKGNGSEFFFCIRLLQGEELEEEQKEEEGKGSLEGIRVLLAEDNELNAEIARELLKMQGILVEWAANGREVVERFENSDRAYYQAILMDIKMPEKNGLEATREIRAGSHPDAKSIVIIAMTANSFKEDKEAAEEAGMNGFIPKPVDSAYLYEVLREAIK